jgi:hypothetical protein
VTDRPILFSGPMVRALIDGRKTQTRRLATSPLRKCEPGDRLWVREKWQLHGRATDFCTVVYGASATRSWTEFSRQFPDSLAAGLSPRPFQEGWRSSLHMPRWASRLTLEVTDVSIEPLNLISWNDAVAEGCPGKLGPNPDFPDEWDPTPTEEYRELWIELHGKASWDANPDVLVLTFRLER